MGESGEMKQMSNEAKIFNDELIAMNINDRCILLIETYDRDVVSQVASRLIEFSVMSTTTE